MKIQAYIYHKRAEKYSDCQDYFGIDAQNNRIAVSDGMSQSIYPQWWAKILVNAYLSKGRVPVLPEELQIYQDVWQDKVQAEIEKRENSGINPWRLKNAFVEKSGAGATLCGFAWDADSWYCECIGDSSLIVINNDYTVEILSSQEGEFGNHPDYLDSFCVGRGLSRRFGRTFENIIAILLVTDPYSELFQKHQKDKNFIKARLAEFHTLSNHASYCELVERWRDDYNMHNDDSTVLLLSEFSSEKCTLGHIDSLEKLCYEEIKADKSNTEITEAFGSTSNVEFVVKGKSTTEEMDNAGKIILTEENPTSLFNKSASEGESETVGKDMVDLMERLKVAETARLKAEERASNAENELRKVKAKQSRNRKFLKHKFKKR